MGSLGPTEIPGSLGSMVSTGANRRAMRDREALVALYNGTGGKNWRSNTNWLTEKPVGQWHGVTTDRAGRVTRLSLDENNLAGAIPAELGNLGSIEQAFLDGNELTGFIPPELGCLARLDWLGLSGNELIGVIPPQLGNLAHLEGLGLGDNNLSGAIPPELGRLGRLQDLWLGQNNLTGAIPAELGNLRSLVWLGLGNNNLMGALPWTVGNLSRLETLSLEHNELTGPLPLSLAGLERLDGLSYFDTGLCVPDDGSLRCMAGVPSRPPGYGCALCIGLLRDPITGQVSVRKPLLPTISQRSDPGKPSNDNTSRTRSACLEIRLLR